MTDKHLVVDEDVHSLVRVEAAVQGVTIRHLVRLMIQREIARREDENAR